MQQTADPGDAPGDVTWMSYAELGRSRGISAASAKRLSNRRRWRKQAGNDGTTRVAVPANEAVPRETISGDVPGDISFYARALAVLEAALIEANKRADAAQMLAERTLAEFAEAGARADRERERVTDLQGELEAARGDAQEAAQAADELRRANEARKARGRLRRAWDGWRGR
jgi:hypothetical protein